MSESNGTGLSKESTAAGGDFFTRLAGRNMGIGSVIRPLTAPRFAPGPAALDDTSREIMTEFFPSSFPAARKLERKIPHIGESRTEVDEYRVDDDFITTKGAKGREEPGPVSGDFEKGGKDRLLNDEFIRDDPGSEDHVSDDFVSDDFARDRSLEPGWPGIRETGALGRESRPDAVDSVKRYGRSSDRVAGTGSKTVEPLSSEQRQRKWDNIDKGNVEAKRVEAKHADARNIEKKVTIEKGSEVKDTGAGDTRENVIETSRTVDDDKEEPGDVLRGEGMPGQSIEHVQDADVSYSPGEEVERIFTAKGTKEAKEKGVMKDESHAPYRSQTQDPFQIPNSETEAAAYSDNEKRITAKKDTAENRGEGKRVEKRGQAGKTPPDAYSASTSKRMMPMDFESSTAPLEEIREIRGQARKTIASTSKRMMPMDFESSTALLKKRGQARKNVVTGTLTNKSPDLTASPAGAAPARMTENALGTPAETAETTALGEIDKPAVQAVLSSQVASSDASSYFPELRHRRYGENRQSIRYRVHRQKESPVHRQSGRSYMSYPGPAFVPGTREQVDETAATDRTPEPGLHKNRLTEPGSDSPSVSPFPSTHRSSPSFSAAESVSGIVPRSVLRETEKRFTTTGTKDTRKKDFGRAVQNVLPGEGDVSQSGKGFDKRLLDEKQPGKIDPGNTGNTENTLPYREPGGKDPDGKRFAGKGMGAKGMSERRWNEKDLNEKKQVQTIWGENNPGNSPESTKPPAYDSRPEKTVKPHLIPKPGDVANARENSGPRTTVTPQGIDKSDNTTMQYGITEPHGITKPRDMAGTHKMVKPSGLAKQGKMTQPGKPAGLPGMAMPDSKPSPERKTIPESKPSSNRMITPSRIANQKPQARTQPGKPDPENLSRAARRMARDSSASSASRLHVSIGRIRIKGNKTPPSPQKSRRAKPSMSLQDFVNRNNRGRN